MCDDVGAGPVLITVRFRDVPDFDPFVKQAHAGNEFSYRLPDKRRATTLKRGQI